MQVFDTTITDGPGIPEVSSPPATPPATPTAIPVMARVGESVPLPRVTQPASRKERIWKAVTRTTKASLKWARRHPGGALLGIAFIIAVSLLLMATAVINQMTAAVDEKNDQLQQLRVELKETQNAVRINTDWAHREAATPWWKKLGRW